MPALLRSLMVTILLTLVATPATARTVTILLGNVPPNVDRNGHGREIEIISRIADACGWTPIFRIEPYGRHWRSFQDGAGDAVGTVPPGLDLGGTHTASYITYRNGVSVLASRGIHPTSLDDLADLSIVAFMGAHTAIPGLTEAKEHFFSYQEIADQMIHSRLLFAGRVDAVLGEGMIVAEYNHRLAKTDRDRFDTTQPVIFTPIFAPTHHEMVFRDPALAEAFNGCLDAVSDDLPAITAQYANRYRDVIGDAYDTE